MRENLCINEARIQSSIDAGDILVNEGSIKRRARTIEEGLRFAMGNKPGILISGVAQSDFFEGFSNRIALIEFDG